jgi:hypothetical protein
MPRTVYATPIALVNVPALELVIPQLGPDGLAFAGSDGEMDRLPVSLRGLGDDFQPVVEVGLGVLRMIQHDSCRVMPDLAPDVDHRVASHGPPVALGGVRLDFSSVR